MQKENWLGTAYAHPDDVPPERWAQSMLTREEYGAMVHERSIRDQRAPIMGALAPDFVARRLTEGKASETASFRLRETRGRPVALVFGSYT